MGREVCKERVLYWQYEKEEVVCAERARNEGRIARRYGIGESSDEHSEHDEGEVKAFICISYDYLIAVKRHGQEANK